MSYTGVRASTFSAGVVSLRTTLEMVGTTPVEKISHWGSMAKPWRVRHHPAMAAYHSAGTSV